MFTINENYAKVNINRWYIIRGTPPMITRLIVASFLCGLTFLVNAQLRTDVSVIRDYVSPIIVGEKSSVSGATTKSIGSGSLIVISPTLAISALHVVENEHDEVGTKKEFIVLRNGQPIPAQVLKKSKDADIALLKGNFQCPCADLGKVEPGVDEEVIAVGYPLYSLYKVQFLTRGNVQGTYNPTGLLVSTTTTAPGGSGGGLFSKQDGKYKLVGVVVAIGALPSGHGLLQTEQMQNWITFSVPLSSINNLLNGVKR